MPCIGQGLIKPVPDTVFPQSWMNEGLKEELGRKECLVWLQKKDSRPYEVRSCIAFMRSTDSLGKPEYRLKHIYSADSLFNEWHMGMIHYTSPSESNDGMLFGYWDMHLENFDHKPSKKEINDLFERWHFSVFEKDWEIVDFGINMDLWMDIFGFVPDWGKL